MKKDICKHCGKEIGLWHEENPSHSFWVHAPEDGFDAYEECGTVAEPINNELGEDMLANFDAISPKPDSDNISCTRLRENITKR